MTKQETNYSDFLKEHKSDLLKNTIPRALAQFVYISPSASSQACVITWPHGHMQDALYKPLIPGSSSLKDL